MSIDLSKQGLSHTVLLKQMVKLEDAGNSLPMLTRHLLATHET
jgi:hypothetical protein